MALAAARAERPATAARGWCSRGPWRSMYVGGLPHEISCRRQAGGELLARSGRLARQCGQGALVRTCTTTSSARQFSARTVECIGRGGAQAGGSAGRGGAQAGGRGRCGAGGCAAHDLRRRGAAAAAPCRPATTASLFLRRFKTRRFDQQAMSAVPASRRESPTASCSARLASLPG
jgi:hypothetical protein